MGVRLWWPLFIFSLIISHLAENYSISIFFYCKYLPTISCHDKRKKNPVCWSFMFQSVRLIFGTYIFFKRLVKPLVFKLYFLCKQKIEFRTKFTLSLAKSQHTYLSNCESIQPLLKVVLSLCKSRANRWSMSALSIIIHF